MSRSPAYAAAALIRASAPVAAPLLGVILGSGLGAVAERLADPVVIPYADLPGFAQPHVAGHAGRLVLGRLAGLSVACLQGRAHVYEGVPPEAVRVPVRALKLAGVERLLLTNAAGSLTPAIGPGRLMLIADHINLMGWNPLTGANDDEFGTRFPSLAGAYDPEMRAGLKAAARRCGIALAEGIYLACAGPSFETAAEIRAFRTLGADAVGMSTVPEVIVARHCGLRVAALSAIVNLAEGLGEAPPSHAETLAVSARIAGDLGRLVEAFAAEAGDG